MIELLQDGKGVALAGVTVVVLLVAVLTIGIKQSSGDFDDVYPIDATFSAIGQGLDQYSDVRLRGVPIGRVAGIAIGEDGRAVISLEIESQYTLPQGTTASIEALSIFGPKFIKVDVDGAAPGAPALAAGATVDMTTGPTELQEAIDSIDRLLGAIDAQELRTVLEVGAETLREMAPASEGFLTGTQALTEVAADRTPEGTQLLADLQRITTQLDGTVERLTRAAADANATLPAINARDEDVTALLDAVVRNANEAASFLEAHPSAGSDLPQGLVGALLPPLAITSGNLDTVPDVIDTLGNFFGTLGRVLHVVDDGQRQGAIEFYIEFTEFCTAAGLGPACELAP